MKSLAQNAWGETVTLPFVAKFLRSGVFVSSVWLMKAVIHGLNPASLATCAHQKGPSQSSTRIVTKFGIPRITNGLRAAHTIPRHTRSSNPLMGPNTEIAIQLVLDHCTAAPRPYLAAETSGRPPLSTIAVVLVGVVSPARLILLRSASVSSV